MARSKSELRDESIKRLEQYRTQEDLDNPLSNNPVREETIDYEAWTEFISYYRYYIDEFAINILGLELFPFQRVILRSMARYGASVLIACRGIGRLTSQIS